MRNYKNGPEEINRIPRMPDAVLECIINNSLFREHANRYEGEERDRLFGLMHDTAEELLARVSLAAPSVANAAPAGELPPLPEPLDDRKLFKLVNALGAFGGGVSRDSIGPQQEAVANLDAYFMGMMQAYARAAIAALPKPVVAMTDERIKEIIFDAHADDGMGEDIDLIKLCRAILAAAGPDAALVEALTEALAVIDDYLEYEHNGDPWTEDARAMGEMDIDDYARDGRIEKARAALAAHAGQGAKT
jgi:hypothetical protein